MSSLEKISFVHANFGNGTCYPLIQEDWLRFLGGRPGEIVVIDGGSDLQTQEMYWQLMASGKIDKLQVIRPDHPENNKDRCFVQEVTAGLVTCKPYILFWKVDTLPFRNGHDGWLEEAIAFLDRPEVFAVSGSFNYNAKYHDAWPGWYFSEICTLNFSLMKRSTFIATMEEFAGEFIRNNFSGVNPAAIPDYPAEGRFLVEKGFTWFMKKHGLFTLVRDEDPSWAILHTNLRDRELLHARERLIKWDGVNKFLDRQKRMQHPYAVYFGQSEYSRAMRHFRIAMGASSLGPIWRYLRANFPGSRAARS